MYERTKEQLNTLKPRTQQRGWECGVAGQSQDVEVDATTKTLEPGTWTELFWERENKKAPITKRSPLIGSATAPIHSKTSIQCNKWWGITWGVGCVLDGKVIKQLRINDLGRITKTLYPVTQLNLSRVLPVQWPVLFADYLSWDLKEI